MVMWITQPTLQVYKVCYTQYWFKKMLVDKKKAYENHLSSQIIINNKVLWYMDIKNKVRYIKCHRSSKEYIIWIYVITIQFPTNFGVVLGVEILCSLFNFLL
jgi:hypothetical protein